MHSSAEQGVDIPSEVLWLGGIPPGTPKQFLEAVFAPWFAVRIDMKPNSSYAFIHFPGVKEATIAKVALAHTEIFLGRGFCQLGWRRQVSQGPRASGTGPVPQAMPPGAPLPQNSQSMVQSFPGHPMPQGLQAPQMQYGGQPVYGGNGQNSHGQAGYGGNGQNFHGHAGYGATMPLVPPTPQWQQQSGGYQSHLPASQPGSIRGPSTVTPAQAFGTPYQPAQPGLPLPGSHSSIEMDWTFSGHQGHVQGPPHNPRSIPTPRTAVGTGAYQGPGVPYVPQTTGAGHAPRGVGAGSQSTGYSAPGASYHRQNAFNLPQAHTFGTQPLTRPNQQNPPQHTVNADGYPLAQRAIGVSHTPSSMPTQPVAQPFQANFTTAAPPASKRDNLSSSANPQPTVASKKKKGKAHNNRGYSATGAANTVKTNSAVPLNSRSQGDLELVALHAGLPTTTGSGLEPGLHSQARLAQPSPAHHSQQSDRGITIDPISHNSPPHLSEPSGSKAESVLGSESCDTSSTPSSKSDKATERV